MGLRRVLLKDMGVSLLHEDNLTLDKGEELVSLPELTTRMVFGKEPAVKVGIVGRQISCYNCGRNRHMTRECRTADNRKENRFHVSKIG